ncbi:hypothetical protein M4I33_06365 [Clostridium sp. LY3-2]|uniref:hypothetical protein n=1 Tax=Clostridium sp. LY3-2 TaxID=2942482 RepID=UPI002152C4CD|nr:hypothetical protein [Clostridium sp. LY3-2]MCR6514500.1 hypothetical protein [Clostridium sp. LY3-2]
MPKGKMDINQNFEMLKAQMQAKRKKAEEQSKTKEEDKVNDIVQNEEPAANKKPKAKKAKKQVIKEEIIKEEPVRSEVEIPVKAAKSSVEIVEEKEEPKKVAVDTLKSLDEAKYIDESSKNSNTQPLEEYEEEIVEPVAPIKREVYKEDEPVYREEKSREASVKITIKKIEKPEAPKRATYYLMNDTIKKIEKISKITGMGKSKLVQTLLDQALENLEIEK